ncbi:type IV pilus modification PilV family protein [Desulfitobacterium metallireducens]|uniref:N-terminal cleavage protein n=1 Tax=Desulfitobacterium metallireducens DSM 15288 TaxID=871968 RepID=W0EDZ6_9FIRM|nr:hypothetical protein [Desulfitobacterium metallireducens]AHF07424.1 N-terminal cleavage protein [Desulfitobacterium metallireducens DSM 15288]
MVIRRKHEEYGFVLIDALIAIFLLTMSFAALYGLTEGAIQNSREALATTEAANLAQNLMEQLSTQSWPDNFAEGKCIPGGKIQGSENGFQWSIFSEWELENVLLKVTTQVSWPKKDHLSIYDITTLYYLQ